MKKEPRLDRGVNKDIVLCSTTNHYVCKNTKRVLIDERISFTASWKKIPFFRRSAYRGATEICTFFISPNIYSKASRTIKAMPMRDRERLVMNII